MRALVISVGIAAATALPAGVAAANRLQSQPVCQADAVSRDMVEDTVLSAATVVDSQQSTCAHSVSRAAGGDTLPANNLGSLPILEPGPASAAARGDTASGVQSPDSPRASVKPLVVDRWLARDKAKHLAVSACFTGLFYQSGKHFMGLDAGDSRRAASVATFAVGVSKEIRDRTHPGSTASFKDLAADGAGILAGLLVFSLMLR